jgi:hypothetical protein
VPCSEKEIIRRLAESRRFTLTTLAKDDWQYADRLQTATVRGEHELLYWGVGPELEPGDMVGLYTPDSDFLPPSERKALKRVYSVATHSTPGTYWNNHVFLYRRITIEPPLTFQDLNQGEGVEVSGLEIARAGTQRKPWPTKRAKAFWRLALRGRPYLAERVLQELQKDRENDVAISYAGEDWTQARRLMLWCTEAGINAFFVTSVGSVLSVEREPLEILLHEAFARTRVALFLVPTTGAWSEWIELELAAALNNAGSILLVRTDNRCSWPTRQRKGVMRHTLEPAEEKTVIAKIKKLL